MLTGHSSGSGNKRSGRDHIDHRRRASAVEGPEVIRHAIIDLITVDYGSQELEELAAIVPRIRRRSCPRRP